MGMQHIFSVCGMKDIEAIKEMIGYRNGHATIGHPTIIVDKKDQWLVVSITDEYFADVISCNTGKPYMGIPDFVFKEVCEQYMVTEHTD